MVFKSHDIAKQFEKIFSISVIGNCLRVSPAYYNKQLNENRNCHRLIIGGLPTNKELKAIDLDFLFKDAGAVAVNIPRNLSNYRTKPYAHVTFKNFDILVEAKKQTYSYQGKVLRWYDHTAARELCYRCGHKHESDEAQSKCKSNNYNGRPRIDTRVQKLYARFKLAQHRNASKKFKPQAWSEVKKGFSYADAAQNRSKNNNNRKPRQDRNPALQPEDFTNRQNSRELRKPTGNYRNAADLEKEDFMSPT